MKFIFFACFAFLALGQVVQFSNNEQERDVVNPPNGATLEATAGLNIRGNPCTNARVITTIAAGARVTFTGRVQNACEYKWYSVKGGFGDGWAASNFLKVVQNNGNLVYGPGLSGLDQTLISKLGELARLCNSRVRVHSGCRQNGCRWHQRCRAADFHVDGWKDAEVYRRAFNNRRMFDRYQFIYHTPGQRRCSSGEHLHVSRPENYAVNSFCYDKTCNWSTECNNIRLGKYGKEEQVQFTKFETKNCTNIWCPDCYHPEN